MLVRVLKRLDGGVSVIRPAPKTQKDGESPSQWFDRICKKANPDDLPYVDIDDGELPSREDRDAWEVDNVTAKVRINLQKAKTLKEEKLIKDEMAVIDDTEKRQKAIDSLKTKGLIP